jgi:hypothetical protein
VSETIDLDGAHTAVRLNSTFVIEYKVTGPAVQNPYGPTRCVPTKLIVTITTKGLALEAQRVVVQGSRAKKDGSPSLVGSEIDLWLGSYARNDIPWWVMEVVNEAMTQVGLWLE